MLDPEEGRLVPSETLIKEIPDCETSLVLLFVYFQL